MSYIVTQLNCYNIISKLRSRQSQELCMCSLIEHMFHTVTVYFDAYNVRANRGDNYMLTASFTVVLNYPDPIQ